MYHTPRPFDRALLLGLAMTACLGVTANAQNYPSKPIRILAPFPAGSGVDVVARTIATPLSAAWGQPVVVDNRPGANGLIACELVAHAVPDGYTLLLGNASTLAIAPSLYKQVPYNPVRDYAPITRIAASANILVVHPSVPARTVQQLIALAQAKPGTLNYASAGAGNSTHLSAELFKQLANVNLVHVPYKGTPQLITDLLSGQVQLSFTSLVSAIPHTKTGRLVALGVTGPQRAASLPDVPTISEAGVKGYEVTVWQGIVAPAKTPPAIIEKLNREIVRILQSAETRDRLAGQGLESAANQPEQFRAYIASEVAKWSSVIKSAGIIPE
jgi:tripartite-type tricarboxylate transporter receptor subunit TctC